jgi:hypothetical protein
MKKKRGALYHMATKFGAENTMARRIGYEVVVLIQSSFGLPLAGVIDSLAGAGDK